MKKTPKTERHKNLKWTFMDHNQSELIANALLGQSNAVINRDTKFSDHEIDYALTKAKHLYGLKQSIRSGWRNGTSDICRQIKADMLAILRKDIQRELPALVLHPTPEVAEVERD